MRPAELTICLTLLAADSYAKDGTDRGSLSSVSKQTQPPIVRDDADERMIAKYEREHNLNGPFRQDIKGQLQRAEAVGHWATKAQLATNMLHPSWAKTYEKWMLPDAIAPAPDIFLAFSILADEANVQIALLANDSNRFLGQPVRFTGRFVREQQLRNPNAGASFIIASSSGHQMGSFLVFSKYLPTPELGSLVDVLGYAAPMIKNPTRTEPTDIATIAAVQVVKGGSIDRAMRDYVKVIKKPGMSPPVSLQDLIAIIRKIK